MGFQRNGFFLTQLLFGGGDQQQEAAPAAPEKKEEPAEAVEVTVKHAINDEEVVVTVLSNATMNDVKQAVESKLARPNLAKEGRVVRKTGGNFSSFKDTEAIGTR